MFVPAHWGMQRRNAIIRQKQYIKDDRKIKFIGDVEQHITEKQKKLFSLVEEIIETNEDNVIAMYKKIEKSGEPIKFIYKVIEYSTKIRPLHTAALASLFCLISKKYGFRKLSFINIRFFSILVHQGILAKEKNIKLMTMSEINEIVPLKLETSIFIRDDVDEFIKKSTEIEFNADSTFSVDINSPIRYALEASNVQVSYLQVMAFFGSIKCFKHSISNGSYKFNNIEYYAVAGGNIEIIHILEQRNVSFECCLDASIKYHRLEISDWILLHYKCDENQLLKSCTYFNYKALIFGLNNGIKCNSLAKAAEQGNLDIIKYLYEEHHLDVELKNSEGQTPVNVASLYGYLDIVKYLVENCHANADTQSKKFNSPLHNAAFNGHFGVVKYLVEQCHLNIEAKNDEGQTPVNRASLNGYLDIVKYLVENCHANINTFSNRGNYPINNAAFNGHLDVVKYLVDECNISVELKNGEGQTPVNSASLKGHIDIVKYLVENCHANADTQSKKFNSPLHNAAFNGHFGVVKYLVEQCHLNIEAKNDEGQTPVNRASLNGYLDIVKYLVENCHANINTFSNRGNYPINNAAFNGHLDVVKYLVEECNADVEIKNNEGLSPINSAAAKGHLDIVKYLVEQCNANVNAQSNKGNTPLINATKNRHDDVVKYLKQYNK